MTGGAAGGTVSTVTVVLVPGTVMVVVVAMSSDVVVGASVVVVGCVLVVTSPSVVVVLSEVVVPLSLSPVVEVLSWPGMVVPGVQFPISGLHAELPDAFAKLAMPSATPATAAATTPLRRRLTLLSSGRVEALSLMIILSLD